MMQARLSVNPETAKIHELKFDNKLRFFYESKRTPTAEEYDAALQAIEELKELATNEPAATKVFNALRRLSAETVYCLTSVGNILSGPMSDSRQTFIDKDHDALMETLQAHKSPHFRGTRKSLNLGFLGQL